MSERARKRMSERPYFLQRIASVIFNPSGVGPFDDGVKSDGSKGLTTSEVTLDRESPRGGVFNDEEAEVEAEEDFDADLTPTYEEGRISSPWTSNIPQSRCSMVPR